MRHISALHAACESPPVTVLCTLTWRALDENQRRAIQPRLHCSQLALIVHATHGGKHRRGRLQLVLGQQGGAGLHGSGGLMGQGSKGGGEGAGGRRVCRGGGVGRWR
jgi:hypothetical protein